MITRNENVEDVSFSISFDSNSTLEVISIKITFLVACITWQMKSISRLLCDWNKVLINPTLMFGANFQYFRSNPQMIGRYWYMFCGFWLNWSFFFCLHVFTIHVKFQNKHIIIKRFLFHSFAEMRTSYTIKIPWNYLPVSINKIFHRIP